MATTPKPTLPRDKTARALYKMLTENTGRHFLDSGGAYGRHWEQNQGLDFEAAQPTLLSFKRGEIEITHHVYHWLKERLEYDAKMTRAFWRWATSGERADEPWLPLMEEWVEKELPRRLAREGKEVTGLYGDGEPSTTNTYNGEDLLSQTLQYTYFEVREPLYRTGDGYVLLQIHGGCDVRGGYTKPRVFKINADDNTAMFDNARAVIGCSRDDAEGPQQLDLNGKIEPKYPHNWTTDDGYHWYYDGGSGGFDLKEAETKEIADRSEWEQGKLCYFEDGAGLCPLCGSALSGGFY